MEANGTKNNVTRRQCIACIEEVNHFYEMNYGTPTVLQQLLICIPFLNLDLITDPVICPDCYISLIHSYLLLKQCMSHYHKLHEYRLKYDHVDNEMKLADIHDPSQFNNEITALKATLKTEMAKKEHRDRFFEEIESSSNFGNEIDGLEAEEIITDEQAHNSLSFIKRTTSQQTGNILLQNAEKPGSSMSVSPDLPECSSSPVQLNLVPRPKRPVFDLSASQSLRNICIDPVVVHAFRPEIVRPQPQVTNTNLPSVQISSSVLQNQNFRQVLMCETCRTIFKKESSLNRHYLIAHNVAK